MNRTIYFHCIVCGFVNVDPAEHCFKCKRNLNMKPSIADRKRWEQIQKQHQAERDAIQHNPVPYLEREEVKINANNNT